MTSYRYIDDLLEEAFVVTKYEEESMDTEHYVVEQLEDITVLKTPERERLELAHNASPEATKGDL